MVDGGCVCGLGQLPWWVMEGGRFGAYDRVKLHPPHLDVITWHTSRVVAGAACYPHTIRLVDLID